MRLGAVETCRLKQLTSGSTGFKPKSFSLQCPCSFCCFRATFTFIPSFNVYLLDARGTIYRVCTALEAEFVGRESPQKTHWERRLQPCSSTAWNVWNHDLHPLPFSHGLFAGCFWGPWVCLSDAYGIPAHTAFSGPFSVTALITQSQVWLLPFSAPGTVSSLGASIPLHKHFSHLPRRTKRKRLWELNSFFFFYLSATPALQHFLSLMKILHHPSATFPSYLYLKAAKVRATWW